MTTVLLLVSMSWAVIGSCYSLAGPRVVVISLAKSGTTSLATYFACGGLYTSHWKCGHSLCGACLQRNLARGQSLFSDCGSYDVLAQIDQYDRATCAWPDERLFDAMRAYRQMSVILSYRDPGEWANSVLRWNNLTQRMSDCGFVPRPTLDALARAYIAYNNAAVNYWVYRHRWPRFTLLRIDSNDTGELLEQTFDIPARCWGRYNVNRRNKP